MVRPIAMPVDRHVYCEECQRRRREADLGSTVSRHVASTDHSSSSSSSYRINTGRAPSWRLVAAIAGTATLLYALVGLPNFCSVLLAVAFRFGPICSLMALLPEVHSEADFENRHYRVQQSLWLVSICCGIYTLIPEETARSGMIGWKMNLVTMETSMASGIAATYGYSVAGGVPGGLLAEFVMSSMGKATVAEISPFVGAGLAKMLTGFGLFMVLGTYMEFFAISAYAFAHQADHAERSDDGREISADARARSASANAPAAEAAAPAAAMAMRVRALPDFSHLLPADYRKGYGQWRSGNARGAKGEPESPKDQEAESHGFSSESLRRFAAPPAMAPAVPAAAAAPRAQRSSSSWHGKKEQ